MSLKKMEMMRQVRLSVCSVFLLILILPLAPALAKTKKDSAKTLYDTAVRLEADLKKTSKSRANAAVWKKTITAFRNVYYMYPSSGYCDNALFHVATLYSQMAEQFQDSFYYHRATATYQFLIEQYSSSSLIEEAMLEAIRIYRDELKRENDAETLLKKLKSRNPKAAAAISKKPPATPTQPATLQSLRHYTGTDYTRIVIDFDKEISFKRDRLSNPDRLYLDFDNTVAMKSLLEQNFQVDDGFLKQIRVGQNTYRKARVVLDLKSIETYEIFSLYHPYRIVIDVQGKKSVAAPPPVVSVMPETTVEPPEKNGNGKYSLARQLGLKVRRIILDPGHGGHDPGAMSAGIREKDITLDVSRRLKMLLQSKYDFEVLMTRDNDRFVALEERTAFANSNAADLFVSVHVNSSRNKRARGIETYYLNFATTPEAMEVAARENAIAEKNMAELQKLTIAIAMNSKIEESRDFASLVQSHLVSYLKKDYAIPSLGVKQAPFYVLIGAQMPSILAEISFLSNHQEFRLLSEDSYRQSIAEGLATGVQRYIQTLAENKLTQNRK
ncbi:N-acetylmuramoyl-L-alanine amidase [bacterium]|nr:N-acetylmuramoyl-L-alanine amidase [bacterium]MCI0606767.1 N-acetylmuramoyl-L-alanine amidase [bacterium]